MTRAWIAVGLAAGVGLAGCPRSTPPLEPEPESADATPADLGAVDAAPATEAEPTPDAAPVSDEPPALPDLRYATRPPGPGEGPVGTPPAIVPTSPPDGEPEPPPDIGDGAREALRQQFGCETVSQPFWPTSWISPTGVVLWCCSSVAPGAPAPADGFLRGCRLPAACSLLIDEGVGAVTRVDTVTALRRRLAPVRDPRTALAVVDAMVPELLPIFGSDPAEVRFLLEGSWEFVASEILGTRIAESPDGGYDVTSLLQPGCGCDHALYEVVFHVDELAGVTEQSRTLVQRSRSTICID